LKNISGISLEVTGSRDKFSDGEGSACVDRKEVTQGELGSREISA